MRTPCSLTRLVSLVEKGIWIAESGDLSRGAPCGNARRGDVGLHMG